MNYKNLPPWCWSKNYIKYGSFMFLVGSIITWSQMSLAIIYGASSIPVWWLAGIAVAQTIRPNVMKKVRPCKDCPITSITDDKYAKTWKEINDCKLPKILRD